MSVLIEGMDLPKDRPQLLWIYPNGKALTVQSDVDPWNELQAVPVPEPHGRLGDLDKLNEEVRLLIKENMFSRDDARDLMETIADAPTVIPASGTEVE